MNLQWLYILSYSLAALWIIAAVGRRLFQQGAAFLKTLFPHNELDLYINRLLLTGYYLLNMGYAAIRLSQEKELDSLIQLVEIWSEQIGLLCLLLGGIHFSNLILLSLLSKSKITF